ncbi:ATP-grasp domain-containing protein [Catenulispora subtropica]|uniref:ATP-grasp domain-containing protein n=1 Tax=Catenulispora subtropica TaxID=450798 RepID=A0ABP5EG36_9ACTN
MTETILIGFAEAFAAIESAWSLADAGYDVVAFTRRGTKPALASSRRVRVLPVTPPEEDAAACVAEVADAAERLGAAAVLPLDDLAVWVCDRTGRRVAGATGDAAAFALDKSLQVAAATNAGLAVPERSADGPWIVKAALAVVEQENRLIRPGGRVAATPADVERATADLAGPVLVQRLLTGVGEGVFGFATEDGVRAWSGHRRVRMADPRGSASSACRSITVDEDLRARTEKLLAAVGWRGMFMLELLRDADGTPWFMEVNGRPWGSMALALRRGLPYPVWAVRQALDPAFVPEPPDPEPPHVVCRHLGRELVHLAAVLRGPIAGHPGPWPRRGATLAALRPRRSDRWYNLRAGERRVFWKDTWSTLAAQAARMRKKTP